MAIENYYLMSVDSSNAVGVRSLTKGEYEKYMLSIAALKKIEMAEQLFQIVELNYLDLKISVQNYLENFGKQPGGPPWFEHLFMDTNRMILNLLSSIRSFLDHSETRFKREFGNSSGELRLFKERTGLAHDSQFSYRFLYKLRNFAQHCGLPSGRVEVVSEAPDAERQQTESSRTLRVLLVKEFLLNDFEWGKLVKADIATQPVGFEIIPLIDEHFDVLKNLNIEMNRGVYSKHRSDGEELLALFKEAIATPGIPCLAEISGNELEREMIIKYFPLKAISEITGTKINITYRKNHVNG